MYNGTGSRSPGDYDDHARPSEDVEQGLRNLRETMRMRLNRKGRVRPQKSGSIDASGRPREIEYEPRWEVWDTDESGRDYKVMTLEDFDTRAFQPPSMATVEWFRRFNPDNWNNPDDMIEAMFREKEKMVTMPEEEFKTFVDFMGEWCWDRLQGHKRHYVTR